MTTIDRLYLNTLKAALIDLHRCDGYTYKDVINFGAYTLTRKKKINKEDRINGEDWPQYAESMIGLKRMDNIQNLIEDIIYNRIPGDLLEAGAWRGGASIFMKANLLVHGSDKNIYVCDSFQGLPRPFLHEDKDDVHYKIKSLAVSLDEVIENFNKWGVLLVGGNVWFVEGWFSETMPGLKNETFSLIRLDGDMYESTMDVLVNLYDSLAIGGYVVVDDWCLPRCKKAVLHFTKGMNVNFVTIDNSSVYWQKT